MTNYLHLIKTLKNFTKIKNKDFMRKIKIILSVLVIFISSNAFTPKKGKDTKVFYVYFFQDGKKIDIVNSTVTLKKEPFKIIVELNDKMIIGVNSSFKQKSYLKSKDGRLIEEINGFENSIKTDSLKAENTSLILSEDSYSYWYYNTKTDNNFSSTILDDNKILCVKEFKTLFDMKDSELLQIKDTKKKIYMTFISFNINTKTGEIEENMREAIKVQWLKN